MGVVQGLTEFLPISSSAHLRILPALVNQPDPGASFTAVIQIGTILSVLIFFWKDFTIIRVPWLGVYLTSKNATKIFEWVFQLR